MIFSHAKKKIAPAIQRLALESGQSIAEYAALLGVILAMAAFIGTIGTRLHDAWQYFLNIMP